jgi:hypothetical protein
MIYEIQTIMGIEDFNYNEIILKYKDSICRKTSEPPSPLKVKTLSSEESPLLGKGA